MRVVFDPVVFGADLHPAAAYPTAWIGQPTASRRVRRNMLGSSGGSVMQEVCSITVGPQFPTTGPLAQLVEQQTLNLRVRGSSPWRLTTSSLIPRRAQHCPPTRSKPEAPPPTLP